MKTNEEVERGLYASGDVEYVKVDGDGYHYHITVVSDAFEGKSKVLRQQWVYAKLNEWIVSGSLHAVNLTTWTKAEWEKQHG